MKKSIRSSVVIALLSLVFSSLALASSANVAIRLSPAGGFVGKTSDVKGVVRKMGAKFEAQNIIVNLKTLKTGMGLRDKHTQEHLETSKYPDAILVKAIGENGKGEGIIKIRGVEKKVTGTYEVNGNQLTAKFPIKLSEFNISGIKYMGIGVKDDAIVTVTVPVQ